jgi:hypothetical protein
VATFGELVDLIELDLAADNNNLLETEVEDAINRAISSYEEQRFVFNEGIDTSLTTTAGTPDYALPAAMLIVDQVQYTHSARKYRLERETYEWYLDAADEQTARVGPANQFTIFANRLYLFPTPSATGDQITIHGVIRLANVPFTADGQSNAWTTNDDALQLIRARAKADIYINRERNLELGGMYQAVAKEYKTKLVGDLGRLRMLDTSPATVF